MTDPAQRERKIEGRWTIKVAEDVWSQGGRMAVVASGPNPGAAPVPVVPCDDAAIERAAQKLIASYSWAEPSTNDMAWRVARAVLRAAGETP